MSLARMSPGFPKFRLEDNVRIPHQFFNVVNLNTVGEISGSQNIFLASGQKQMNALWCYAPLSYPLNCNDGI